MLSAVHCSAPVGPQRRAEVVFADSSEWQTLNPLYMYGGNANRLGALVYSQLFRHSADGQLVPSLAAEVPTVQNGGITNHGLVVTYRLKHDAKWADGAPLTARDVVFTHEADMNPRNAAVDRQGDERIASISAPDPFTVKVTLKSAYAPFLLEFNRPLLPAHLLAGYVSLDRADYNTHPIGSGPYRVSEWKRGDHITFVRDDGYWGKRAGVSRIVVRFVPDPRTIVAGLESGEIDGAGFVDPVSVEPLAKSRTLHTTTASNAFAVMLFNASHETLSDARVRRAVTMAIDRARLIEDASAGLTDPAEPERAIFGWAYDRSIRPLPYDPNGARRLLDESGWKPGEDRIRVRAGRRLELNIVTQAGHSDLAIEANIAAQDLKQVGIQANIRSYADQEYFSIPGGILSAGHFDVTLSRFGSGDAPYDVSGYVGCDISGKPTTYNFTHMCLRHMGPVLRDAMSTFDRKRQLRDFRIVQQALRDQAPFVVLSRSLYYYVTSNRLHGFVPTPFGEFQSVESWWLSSE
jgi:peptide/nickel transport system substrate-binding protein